MNDDSIIRRLLETTRKRVRELQDEEISREICHALGERRIRDVHDFLMAIEMESGWKKACDALINSIHQDYPVSISSTRQKKHLEPLKAREGVFSLFGCLGFEPIHIELHDLLQDISSAKSYISARKKVFRLIRDAADWHIENGDSLFFDPMPMNIEDSCLMKLKTKIEHCQAEHIRNIRLLKHPESIDITPLWHSEVGRRTLLSLGISGDTLPEKDIHVVLSVIPVSSILRRRMLIMQNDYIEQCSTTKPLNPLYDDLLNALKNQNVSKMIELGSRHAFPVLDMQLRNHLDDYNHSRNSSTFRLFLMSLMDHVSIRWVKSVLTLSQMISLPDPRITSSVIKALGVFYSEDSAYALLQGFCRSNNRTIRSAILNSIDSLREKCPETKRVILEFLSDTCIHAHELQRYYNRTWKS